MTWRPSTCCPAPTVGPLSMTKNRTKLMSTGGYPIPYVEASVLSHWVHGRDWPVGSELTLTIAGTDFSATATVAHNQDRTSGDPNDIRADFNLGDFQLEPGMHLTVTDGTTARSLTISSLQVTGIDVVN